MDLNIISNKKIQLDKLLCKLKELRNRHSVLNGSTQLDFKLVVNGMDFDISYTDKGYMKTYRPNYEKLRAVLQAAISDEILEVEQYIEIAKEELKQVVAEEVSKI